MGRAMPPIGGRMARLARRVSFFLLDLAALGSFALLAARLVNKLILARAFMVTELQEPGGLRVGVARRTDLACHRTAPTATDVGRSQASAQASSATTTRLSTHALTSWSPSAAASAAESW